MADSVLLTGADGLLGAAVARLDWPSDVRVHGLDRGRLDISDRRAVHEAFGAIKPRVVINCAAYTRVDQAESEVAEAFAVNAQGPANLAEAARAVDAAIVHVSSDYVFDGRKGSAYVESDAPGPLGVYGAGKLAGELAVRLGQPRSVILRSGWLLSPRGRSFATAILERARRGEPLAVVDDQRGSPTAVEDLAVAVQTAALRMVRDRAAPRGVYHFAGAGEASWWDVATALVQAGVQGGTEPAVRAIRTGDYPAVAIRPAHSALCSDAFERDFGLRARPWRQAVTDMFGPADEGGAS